MRHSLHKANAEPDGVHFRFIASFKLSFKFSPEDHAVRKVTLDNRDMGDRPVAKGRTVENGELK